MEKEEISELYIRLAFQYKSVIDMLLAKGLIDKDFATTHKEKFYDTLDEEKLRAYKKVEGYRETIRLYMRKMTCNDMASLTELARQYSGESPGYVIQS